MTNKTEMVSVPRELLERIVAVYASSPWPSWYELRASLEAAPAEDVRAVGEPVVFKLKECADGYGHGGQWCGPEYNCWLDRRPKVNK